MNEPTFPPQKDPFELITQGEPSADFLALKDSPFLVLAKYYITILLQNFHDPVGNFIEQFQSQNGFHARLWELYLSETFRSLGLDVKQGYDRPDFLLSNGQTEVFVEATTSTPSASGPLSMPSDPLQDQTLGLMELHDFFSLKIGGPLFNKIEKEYWNLPHVQGKPLVFAIKPTHGVDSHYRTFMDVALYLYGIRTKFNPAWPNFAGYENIVEREFGGKIAPGGFFQNNNPNLAEKIPFISGVLFNNQGGLSRFIEMATTFFRGIMQLKGPINQTDYKLGDIFKFTEEIPRGSLGKPIQKRAILTNDKDPVETKLEEGLVFFHNPFARNPVPVGFFGPNVLELSFDPATLQPILLNAPDPFFYRGATLVEVQRPSGLWETRYVY
jgi:hypothetical protein